MKHFAMSRIVVLIAAVLFASANLNGAVPNTLHHQGRIAVNGVNYDGPGSLKFLIFTDPDTNHTSGNEVALWKNDDAAPANLTAPVAAVPVLVSKGLYAVLLGDAGQAVLPASLVPPSGSRLYLRIWFDNGVNGLQQLSPDQELASVPFARHAETASSFSGNLDLGPASVATQTLLVGPPGQTVSVTSFLNSPGRLSIVGDLEVGGIGESSFLGDMEVEGKLTIGTMNSSLIPHVDNTFDLGFSSFRWRQLLLGPMGLSIGDNGDLATLSFNPATDLLTVSRDTFIDGNLTVNGTLNATTVAGYAPTAADNSFTGLNTFSQNVSTAGDYRFTAARTAKLQVSPAEFRPGPLTSASSYDAGSAAIIPGSVSSDQEYSAGIQLPKGATLTEVRFHLWDEAGGLVLANFYGAIRSRTAGMPSLVLLGSVLDIGGVSLTQIISTFTDAVIDDTRQYTLYFKFDVASAGPGSPNLGFIGATVTYTTDTLQP